MAEKKDFFKEKKEWSKVKDTLLGCYLKPYFSKILYTKQPVNYIDGFAGKGNFDNGDLGSPCIAIDIANTVVGFSNSKQKKISFSFIEKEYCENLTKNIAKYNVNSFPARVISGYYEENIEKILKDKERENIFLYVDPYGIKSINFKIFERLAKKKFNSFELFLNLNTHGFIREGCRLLKVKYITNDEEIEEREELNNGKNSISNMNEVAGGDYWQDIVKNNIGFEAEKIFAKEYCENLKKHFKYVFNIPIRAREGLIPKYRMIFATNHPSGCILMHDNMLNHWNDIKKLQSGGQLALFNCSLDNIVMNDTEIEKSVLELLSDKYIDIELFLASFINFHGVKYKTSILRNKLKELEKIGEILVLRNPAVSPKGRETKFMESKKNQSIKVRKK